MRALALIALALLIGCQSEEPAQTDATESPPKAQTAAAKSSCTVTNVVDGDTVKVTCPSGAAGTLRLMGFDTPETYRAGCPAELERGKEATRFLAKRIKAAKEITFDANGTDKYRRILAVMYLDGVDVADIMVEADMAVRYHGEKRIDWCARLGAS